MEDNEAVKKTVKQIFTEYLTSHAHRKTPERFAILDEIYSFDGHFDIDTLYENMEKQAKFRVSRATLYNTLSLLIDARLVIKHQFGTSSQYERSYNCDFHHHLICTHCGKVTEFHDDTLQADILKVKMPRFYASSYSLYIYGLCSTCNRKLKTKIKSTK